MTEKITLYDQFGRPIERDVLKQSIAGPTIAGVRSPYSGYPGDGLNPRRLASILREADAGDPLRYLELAEQIEERDLHYVGVLGTRKRSVTQLDITVDAASDDPQHVAHADMLRDWLQRDELQDELFDILDAIGKGISYTEIIWDTSAGQWQPARLEWRDPRWFRPAHADGRTPLLRSEDGDKPLPACKFITAALRAKSGLPLRSGIARLATWSWMFKAFTMRDWAIFAQTFGQPVRVGKYPAGTIDKDKDTLFRAVANIAGDCAAIIPESMLIEFVESANVGQGHQLYKERCDWLDQQVSKAVLGQTATTDAVTGGLGSGKEHRQVQEDIERADAKALAAILNRDLVRPWIDLEYGPQQKYPKLKIGRAEQRDITTTVAAVEKLVGMGLRVQASDMRDLVGLADPDAGAEVLTASQPTSPFGGVGGSLFGAPASTAMTMHARTYARAEDDDVDAIASTAEKLVAPAADALIDTIRNAVDEAGSFEDLQAALQGLKAKMPTAELAQLMRIAMVMAELAGRDDIQKQAEAAQ
ncbi:MAG: DUF935 domain-containing protein [Rhizobiales bacterium]|nr:DUF935 domain-containing protein [Hyphomicrobiales bacterium]